MAVKKRKHPLIFVSKQAVPFKKDRPLQLMLTIYFAVFVFFSLNPVNNLQWWFLSLPSAIVLACMMIFYRKGRLSNLSYFSVLVFLILNTLGAHYTYALCPVGEWMKGSFGFVRNNYDRLVYLAFGLLLSIPAIEVLYRRFRLRYIQACLITVFIIVALCAINSLTEMLIAAVSRSQQLFILAEAQGDIWDSQRDTAMGLLGTSLNMGYCIFVKLSRNQRIHMVKVSK